MSLRSWRSGKAKGQTVLQNCPSRVATEDALLEDFVHMYGWKWKELLNCPVDTLTYGKIQIDNHVPLFVLDRLARPGKQELESIAHFCIIDGQAARVTFQFLQVVALFDELFERHNFSEDGIVSFAGSNPMVLASRVNALFSSFLIAGKRVLDLMESGLKKYAPGDKGYDSWKDCSSTFYDESLDYAFCYDFRNCIEHEASLVSIVNIDNRVKTAGFAINVDIGILDLRFSANLKGRLKEFARRRKDDGLSPWLSVGSIAHCYFHQIEVLYGIYRSVVLKELSGLTPEYKRILETLPVDANCIIRVMGDDAYTPSKRVYSFADLPVLQLLSDGDATSPDKVKYCPS